MPGWALGSKTGEVTWHLFGFAGDETGEFTWLVLIRSLSVLQPAMQLDTITRVKFGSKRGEFTWHRCDIFLVAKRANFRGTELPMSGRP